MLKRIQQNERDKTRLRRCSGFFSFMNLLACCAFCADFCCKVVYFRERKFTSPDIKRVFFLFLLIRPFGLFLIFTYNLIVEIKWLGEGMETLLGLGQEKAQKPGEEDELKEGGALDSSLEGELARVLGPRPGEAHRR